MIRIRRILCPIDFSRFSRHALEQAVHLARETGAEVMVLHADAVVPVTDVVHVGAAVPFEPARLSSDERHAVLTRVREFTFEVEADGVSIVPRMIEQDPVRGIIDTAVTWSADMIVIGTHGRSGFERLLLGSVTEKILRKAPCPVLTVPSHMASARRGVTFAPILCGIDFSPASLHALDYATSLAAREGPGVHALHVIELFSEGGGMHGERILDTPDLRASLIRTAQERLRDAIPQEIRDRCPVIESVTMGKAYREILGIAADEKAELIVLGVQGRSSADLLLFGSTTQHVVRQAECPVLTIRV